MKRGIISLAILLAVTQGVHSESSFLIHYGKVNVHTEGMLEDQARTIVDITSWSSDSLPANIDSVLKFTTKDDGMWLHVPSCQDVDISLVQDVAGRFTPWKLQGILPTGLKQWDRPLVVQLDDSLGCYLFTILAERRWTKVIIGTGHERDMEAYTNLRDMIRRYQRERVERMEEMFRK